MFKPGNKAGRQFTSTHQPRKAGRKPGLFKQLANIVDKELHLELSKEDYIKLQRWILERNKAELIKINQNPETPMFISVLITAILADLESGKYDTIDKTFDRIFGRSVQPLQVDQVIKNEHRMFDFIKVENLENEDLEKIGEILKKATDK